MDYESHSGKLFTKKELEKISAATTFCIAYIARCEYVLDPQYER